MAIARFPSFVLDCDDPGRLADFYGTLLDWKASSDDGWGEVRNAAGDQCICFQRVEHFQPPAWPGQDIPQQMHMTLCGFGLMPSLPGWANSSGARRSRNS